MDRNLARYSDPAVVGYYGAQEGLLACEAHLVERHVAPGSSILDIGVGGGRTSAALSAHASRYVGVDYAAAMVAASQARYPHLTFVEADATRMPQFADASFDTVMFAFNAIDYIPDDAGRAAALREIARVLTPGGILILSSHNARGVAVRPLVEGVALPRAAWRVLRAGIVSLRQGARVLASNAFAKGEGYVLDPVHGGLRTYISTPKTFQPQLVAAGFEVLEKLGGLYPLSGPDWVQPWFYYACRKGHPA